MRKRSAKARATPWPRAVIEPNLKRELVDTLLQFPFEVPFESRNASARHAFLRLRAERCLADGHAAMAVLAHADDLSAQNECAGHRS